MLNPHGFAGDPISVVFRCADYYLCSRNQHNNTMSIKYEIQSIKNAQGKGNEHRFARIFEQEPMTANELESQIQANCSLTKGDIAASLKALCDCMRHELSTGRRFHLPEIGYFSLSVDLDMPDDKPTDKARADHISVRNINFRPDASLLADVQCSARFERAKFSTKSRQYTEEQLVARLRDFFATHDCLTRRDLEREFGLRQSAALRWLRRLTGSGVLRKDGVRTAPVYFLNT